MSVQEEFKTDIPLKQDKKGRYYLPNHMFCDVLDKKTILVNTPSIGVTIYGVHTNKDGSRWIKGNNIAKYWFTPTYEAPNRLFLDEEITKRIGEL